MRSQRNNSSDSESAMPFARARKESGEQMVRGPSRVADQVFESIARAIFAGELKPGEPLQTHRELAKAFEASPVLVRQAIHRLEELNLVRVRHGSGTVVLDPDESPDLRMLQLRIQLADPSPSLTASVLEVQALGIVPMLLLAERRMRDDELAALRALTEALPEHASEQALRDFVRDYWYRVARATRNFWFGQQVRWWWMLLDELRKRERDVPPPGTPPRVREIYLALTRALELRDGAAQVYCESIEPLLEWLDGQVAQRGG